MNMYENRQDYAYDLIKKLVLTAELKPNEKISRAELSKELHIGNTPMREAIIRLEKEGLFRIMPQSGTFVSKIDAEEIKQAFFVRQNIERLVFKEACELITSKQIKELEKMLVIQRLLSDTNDNEMFFNFDDEFHEFFYKVANKGYIWKWMETISLSLKRYRFLELKVQEPSWHVMQSEHEQIVKLLKKKEHEELNNLVDHHINNMEPHIDFVLKSFPDYFEQQGDYKTMDK